MYRKATKTRERGAAATIVAVLAAGGVLMGMLALSVDVGNMMFERRQLQNGADATAMALAQACARTPAAAECSPTPGVGLQALNNANAPSDGQHGFYGRADAPAGICGRGVPGLPPCVSAVDDGDIHDLSQCPALPGWLKGNPLIPYVETYTRSESSIGPALSFFFAEGDATVVNCARAAFGSPGSTGGTFPLTISLCNWERTTNNGANFAPSPPYSGYPDGGPTSPRPPVVEPFVTSVNAHVPGNPDDYCGPTKYAPGGFGWLEDAGGCTAIFSASGTVPGGTGSSPDGTCKDDMQKYLGTEVLIPVFSHVSGSGSGATFTLAGISSFYLAGWQDIPSAKPSKTHSVYRMPTPGPNPAPAPGFCYEGGKDANCIWGWFTSPLLPVGTISPTAPDRGPAVIQMTG